MARSQVLGEPRLETGDKQTNKELELMQRIRSVGATFIAAIALTALAAATASAAAPTILPGSGTFTSTSGLGTLFTKAGSEIVCKADTNKGTVLSAQKVDATIDFTGCTAFGLPMNSVGDAAGTLLVVLSGSACYVNKANKEVGLDLSVTPLNIEVPAIGGKITIKGNVIGAFTPVNTNQTGPFALTFKQVSNGVQSITKCEGGITRSLLTSTNGGTFEASSEVTTDFITFAVAHEIMA